MSDNGTPDLSAEAVDQLAEAVGQLSDQELAEVLAAQPGGYRGVIDQVMAGMAAAYQPDRTGGQTAVVQWNVATPDGTETFHLDCGPDSCQVGAGPAEAPRMTFELGLADFLRLVLGKLDGMQAFMTGKLRIEGDIMAAQAFQGWFDRPTSGA